MNNYNTSNTRQVPTTPSRPRPPYQQRPPYSNRPPFFQQPPFSQQPGFPGSPPFEGPSDFPPSGPSSGPPSGAPPSFQPPQSPGLYKVDPGAIRSCIYQYVYIWLENGRSFWAWLTYVGRSSVAGWRWNGYYWTYFGTDLDNISSFECF